MSKIQTHALPQVADEPLTVAKLRAAKEALDRGQLEDLKRVHRYAMSVVNWAIGVPIERELGRAISALSRVLYSDIEFNAIKYRVRGSRARLRRLGRI